MVFEIVVIVILVILLVNQFNLWNRFTVWFNQQSDSEAGESGRNYKGYIFIVLVGAIFAFITAYFQTAREINFAATSLALEQLAMNNEVIAESAMNAQTAAFQNAFDFTSLYWQKFFENATLFILLPVLISLGTVFMQDEMKKTKEELAQVTIGDAQKVEPEPEIEVTETTEPIETTEPTEEPIVNEDIAVLAEEEINEEADDDTTELS